MNAKEKKALIICHSRSGNSMRLAQKAAAILKKRGIGSQIAELKPAFDITYPGWLLLSLFPNLKFPIKYVIARPQDFDFALLFLPKWTISNPVANKLISRLGRAFPPTGVVVSYGGWRGEEFLLALKASIWVRGVKVLGGILIKRSEEELEEQKLADFLDSIVPQ